MLFPTPILILTRERPPRPIFEVAEICGVVRVSNWLELLHTLLVANLLWVRLTAVMVASFEL